MAKGFGSQLQIPDNSQEKSSKRRAIASINEIQDSLLGYIDKIEDPRLSRTKKHLLSDILAIAILAVIGGAEGWEDMENYG